MDISKSLAAYYDEHCFDEDLRLSSNSAEYLMTLTLLKEYIKTKAKILDLGGGTGIYSLPLSKCGHKITLVDLSEKELEIANKKASESGLKIKTVVADARTYSDDIKYDFVLCLGPLYHCSSELDIEHIISNVLTRLRSGGIAFFTFISKYAKFNRFIEEINNYPEDNIIKLKPILDSREKQKTVFVFENRHNIPISFVNPLSIRKYLERFNIEVLDTLSIDICRDIENFNKDVFDVLYELGKGFMIVNGEHILSIIKSK